MRDLSPQPFPARELWRYLTAPRISWVSFVLLTAAVTVIRDALGW